MLTMIIAALVAAPFGVLIALEGPLMNAVLLQKYKMAPRRWVSAAISAGVTLVMLGFMAWTLNGAAINAPNALAEAASILIFSAAFAWRWAFWFTDKMNPPDRGDGQN